MDRTLADTLTENLKSARTPEAEQIAAATSAVKSAIRITLAS